MGKMERSRLEKQLLFYTKKASQYTSQCDWGNITFVVYVKRKSLFKGAQEILWRISNARLNRCNLIDLVADFTRGHQSSVQQLNLWVGACCINSKHEIFRSESSISG